DDLVAAVRDTAVLATLQMGKWTGKANDPARVREAKERHGARGNVGTFNKNLMSGCDAHLKAIETAYAACRERHDMLTLTWSSGRGAPRLLPNVLVDRYLNEMAALRTAALNTVKDFLAVYDQLVQQARANLGGMADYKYPTRDEIEKRFYITFDFDVISDQK